MRTEHTKDIVEEIHDHCIDIQQRKIFIHSSLNEQDDSGIDFRVSNKFVKNISILDEKDKSIEIVLNTIGGNFSQGMMIYDAISTAKSHISIVCHGEVCSAGTVILQAADYRYSMPNCTFMLHFGGLSIEDSHLAAQSFMEYDKLCAEKMIDIYAKKAKKGEYFKDKTDLQIKRFFQNKFKNKGDWFINAEEAKYYGLIDKVINGV